MPDISEVSFDLKGFHLFKGDPGTGKSPAACSWPEPYLFDVDGRIQSVAQYWRGKKKIAYDNYINNYPGIMDKIDKLTDRNPYGTLIMDGITTVARSIQRACFDSRLPGAKFRDSSGTEREYKNMITNAKTGFKGVPKLEMDDYMAENNGIIQMLDGLRSLWNDGKGCNVIVIGHVITSEQKDLKGRITTTRRLITGGTKIAAEIPIYFNEAYHFNVESFGNRKYQIFTRNEGDDWAKTTLPIPDKIDFTDRNLYDDIQWFIAEWKKEHEPANV